MRVNDVDIKKFNAVQLKVDMQPPQAAVNAEWMDGAPVPHEFETQVKYGTLSVSMLFRGSQRRLADNRNSIIREISSFLSLLTKRSRIDLDGYKGQYIGDLTTSKIEKTLTADRYILTVNFNGYLADTEIEHEYHGATKAEFSTLGTRAAPCVVEITPQADIARLTISGFGDDDITLSNLKAGKTVIIDGQRGLVTQEGANKFPDCDIWAFPVLQAGADNIITFSSNRTDVKIHYAPMWL